MRDWATLVRTRAVWALLRTVSPQRLRRLHESGRATAVEQALLGRGDLQVLGGLGVHQRLSAPHFPYWSVHAFGYLAGGHEPMVQEALRRSLRPGDTVVDVGANVGVASLLAARLVGPEGRVLALDPAPECAAAVRASAAASGLDHVDVLEAAAGARSGEADLIVTADSLWTRLATVGEHPLERRRERVRVVALDDLALDRVDLVKIDVEGAELDVVAGMGRVLAEHRPVVVCEMHGKNAAFVAAMAAHGYDVANLDDPSPVAEAGGNVHTLCRPRTRAARRPSRDVAAIWERELAAVPFAAWEVRDGDRVLAARDTERRFSGGSMVKTLVAAVVADMVARGELAWEQPAEAAPVGGDGLLRASPGPVALPLEQQVALMIALSDNTALNAVVEAAGGLDAVNERFAAFGWVSRLRQWSGGARRSERADEWHADPSLPSPAGLSVVTIADHQAALAWILDQDDSRLAACFAAQQDRRSLARRLDHDAELLHKTGTVARVRHDAGVLRAGGSDLWLACFTDGGPEAEHVDHPACVAMGEAVRQTLLALGRDDLLVREAG